MPTRKLRAGSEHFTDTRSCGRCTGLCIAALAAIVMLLLLDKLLEKQTCMRTPSREHGGESQSAGFLRSDSGEAVARGAAADTVRALAAISGPSAAPDRRAVVVSPPEGWREIAQHPVGVLEGATVWHEGELWTLGGHPCDGERSFDDPTNVFVYNVSSNSWLPRPRLPLLHHIFSAAFSTPGRITVIGGLEALRGGVHRSNEYAYTLDTTAAARSSATWAWKRTQTLDRKHILLPRPDGIITCTPRLDAQTQLAYCIAGATSNFILYKKLLSRFFLSFDPVTLKVGLCERPPPLAQSNHATLLTVPEGGRVILLQGRDDLLDSPKNDAVFMYTVSSNSWTQLPPPPPFVLGFDTRIAWQHPTEPWALLFGGQDASTFATTALIIRVDFGRSEDDAVPPLTFSPFSAVPQTISAPAIIAIGGDDAPPPLRLAIIGGAPSVGVYCTRTAYEWLVQPDLPAARAAMDVVHSGSGEGTGGERGAAASRQPLTVVAAFYGHYVVTSALQRLLDSGVRGIHMGGGPGGENPGQRVNKAVIDLPDFGVVLQGKGAEALSAVVRTADGTLHTVSCPRDGACLF
jgi:hypothetical protein